MYCALHSTYLIMNSERAASRNAAVHLCAHTIMCLLPSRCDVSLCYNIGTVSVRIADISNHEICGSHSSATEDSGLLCCDSVAGRVVSDVSKDRLQCQALEEPSGYSAWTEGKAGNTQ